MAEENDKSNVTSRINFHRYTREFTKVADAILLCIVPILVYVQPKQEVAVV